MPYRCKRRIPLDACRPPHAAKFGCVFGEYVVVDLFLNFGWHSRPGNWDLVASSLEHAHNQTNFQDEVASQHGRSVVAHVSADTDAGWKTMPISPDFKRVPSAGIVAGSPDAGTETRPIPPNCERVPGSGVIASATDARWEPMSIPPDLHTHQAPALPPVPLALAGRSCRSHQTANACLVSETTPVTFFCAVLR